LHFEGAGGVESQALMPLNAAGNRTSIGWRFNVFAGVHDFDSKICNCPQT
jgi:hypothetical protein